MAAVNVVRNTILRIPVECGTPEHNRLMLASTSTEGTRAAVEYVTRPDYAARLVGSLRGKDGVPPKYFQVVVKAQFKSQAPIHFEQIPAHVLGN